MLIKQQLIVSCNIERQYHYYYLVLQRPIQNKLQATDGYISLNLKKQDLYEFAKNSFQYSLLENDIKKERLKELELFFEQNQN